MLFLTAPPKPIPSSACTPSPCGPFSNCKDVGNFPRCSCQKGYKGLPPTCRPECVVNSDCPVQSACINQNCQNPCIGICGTDAECRVISHNPVCSCRPQFTGDPLSHCIPASKRKHPKNSIYVSVIKIECHT